MLFPGETGNALVWKVGPVMRARLTSYHRDVPRPLLPIRLAGFYIVASP